MKPSRELEHRESHSQLRYHDTVAHDEHGRFTSTRFVSKLTGQPHYSHENLLLLKAESMSHTTIDKPTTVFNILRLDSTTRSFLRKMACQNKPVYFVTGVQTLINPCFSRAIVQHGIVAEATSPQFRLPVRRVDSASNLGADTTITATFGSPKDVEPLESILAVELLKVKCRVGSSSEPHCVSDLDYSWSYHALDDEDDIQLSIGLGKALETGELRALSGIASEELGSEASWGEYASSEDGIGGF